MSRIRNDLFILVYDHDVLGEFKGFLNLTQFMALSRCLMALDGKAITQVDGRY